MVYVESPHDESVQSEPAQKSPPQSDKSTEKQSAPPEQELQSEPPSLEKPPEPLIRKRSNSYANQGSRIILCSILVGIAALLGIVYVGIVLRSDSIDTTDSPPVAVRNDMVRNDIVRDDEKPQNVQTDQNGADSQMSESPETVAETVETTDPTESPLNGKIAQHEPQSAEPLDEMLETDEMLTKQEIAENTEDATIAPEPIALEPIVEHPLIHVEERLRIVIKGLESSQTTLYKVVQFLSDYSGIPITWDVPGMRLFEIPFDKPIQIQLSETVVEEALTSILRQNQLTFLIDHSQIFIFPQLAADPTLKEVKYDISDLLHPSQENDSQKNGRPLTVEQMVGAIPVLIAPLSWATPSESHDGGGAIRAEGDVLHIVQTEMNHREVLRFLEMIRLAKKIPTKSNLSPQKIIPEHFGYERLDRQITFHYIVETPLSEMLELLSQTTKLKILVNHRILNEEMIPFHSLNGFVHVEKGTVCDVLNEILNSVNELDLAYRIVDSDVVEITSYDSLFLPEMQSLESHFYGTKLRSQMAAEERHTPEDMVEMLKNTISPDSWSETTFGGGAILIDHTSETFFVRQSQSVQQIIRAWLKE